MLNSVFRIGSAPRQQQQAVQVPIAKQHASLKEQNANTPTRRVLAPVTGNQVNAIQRIKNFVTGPSGSSFSIASDFPQQTASAKKRACTSSAKKDRRQVQDQDVNLMSPVRNLSLMSPNPPPRSTYHSSASTVVPAKQTAATSILLSDDIMALVTKEMDVSTAMKARAVCKSWKRLVKEADLEPLEAGGSDAEKALGKEGQQHLEEALALEIQVWTPQHTDNISKHLSKQEEQITAEMRRTLVNWLIEVHFKFRFREPCLHLTIQLLDRYLAGNVVTRRKYQTVGVTAFMLGCKYEERHNPNLGDLSYITDYSSSRQDIIDMEKEILLKLNFDMKHPKPTDFLERFSKAAKLESTKRTNQQYTKSYSITLYFIDIAFIDENLCHTRPSLVAAAGVMCTLRVLGRSDWSSQLSHYTTYSRDEVAALADKLVANGRASQATAMGLKYTSRRLGGNGDKLGADGKSINDGCLHLLKNFYAATAPSLLQPHRYPSSSNTYYSHPQQTVHSAYV